MKTRDVDLVSSELGQAVAALDRWDVATASTLCQQVLTKVRTCKSDARRRGDELVANLAWVAENYVELLLRYSDFWQAVSAGQWRRAWSALQRARVQLSSLRRVVPYDERLEWFDRQLRHLDNAFLHSVFASIEYEAKELLCSICRRNIDDRACIHLPGRLYGGEVARIMPKVERITGVSLVANPANRECVMRIEGVREAYPLLEYIRDHATSPFQAITALFPASRVLGVQGKPTRNKPCPCGSGKKFKRCCLGRWYTDSTDPHLAFGDPIPYLQLSPVPTLPTA